MKYGIFESKILSRVQNVLSKFGDELANSHLNYEILFKYSESTSDGYTSEIEIIFKNEESLIDIIEFLIYHHDEICVDETALEGELSLDVEKIILRFSL